MDSIQKISSMVIKNTNFIFMLLITMVLINISCKESKPASAENEQTITNEESKPVDDSKETKKVIMFYGNSLTAGYRLEESESFPSRIEDMIFYCCMNIVILFQSS